MSIDNNSVVSKYFTKNCSDESLSDFQEAKKSCKGPKIVQKPSKVKKQKHIKGQKDIRTALKGKKNELISYAKEFDNVCKQAGVDVDSEQLQLAIALSKSLQREPEISQSSHSLSTQQRVGKIRTTLQEYGFKIPEKVTNKRIKKHRRQYKLLSSTEEEKSQIISEKYSKILFQNLDCKEFSNNFREYPEHSLVYVSTNITYECMKDNTVFYINNLVEESTTTGALLRDWSHIPGRPISPALFDMTTMNFKEIDYSQDEIDILLSGSYKSVQNIIRSKQIERDKANSGSSKIIVDIDKENIVKSNIVDDDIKGNVYSELKLPNIQISTEKSHGIEYRSNETLVTQYRSCSPDIFDDEVSLVLDSVKNTDILSQEHKTKLFVEDNLMDFTECANILSQNSNKTQISQNATKRKSNDVMEITECVIPSSHPILENNVNIDLTQTPEEKDTVEKQHGSLVFDNKSIDSTQPLDIICLIESPKHGTAMSNSERNTENADIFQSPKDDIDLTQSSNEDKPTEFESNDELSNKNKAEHMDLTQSSDTSDELPFVQLSNTQKSLEETIIVDKNEYLDIGKVKCSIMPEQHKKESLNLTQEESYEVAIYASPKKKTSDLKNQSIQFFEEFVHDHSEQSTENIVEIDESCNEDLNSSKIKDKIDGSDIDLTQDSDTSRDSNLSPVTTPKFPNNSSRGKRDDVSIDYDEICNRTNEDSYINSDKTFEIQNQSNTKQTNTLNNDLVSNCSQNSEFEISDKELDYSLHQSRIDANNFDFGGISVLDNITRINNTSYHEQNSIVNKHTNENFDSFLPEVNIKKDETPNTHFKNSPCKVKATETPKNEDYIIKTNEVTPMMDFASMTTPQRNRELNKYGLKPFKRKRAIQLLTHLYNQTHPIIESCADDQQSPSKKRKNEPLVSKTPKRLPKSPYKNPSISPDNVLRSPKKRKQCGEHLCVYQVTSEGPDIRSIECCPEDWVFQKREKAKVHSCRVPLHIAFHNYVSSRRDLREAILKYEPVNIDVIHKDLVGYGHRYDPKDLLKYLDKKCITVKTTDNNARNNKR